MHDYNSSDYSNGSSADSDGDADANMLDSLDGGANEPWVPIGAGVGKA